MKLRFTIYLFILILLPATLSAQGEWKWANYWSGTGGSASDYINAITKTAFDEEGNIYVFGTMGGQPTLNGLTFQFTDNPQVYGLNQRTSLLAKFDTLGNMLWYKVVKTSSNAICSAHWLEVKDEKVIISGNCEMDYVEDPASVNNVWLYFLDTLITGPQVHSIPVEQRQPPYKTGRYTYFSTFDLDGNLLENHFVEARSRRINSSGQRGEEFLCAGTGLGMSPFHVDTEGNTYVYTRLEYGGLESDPYTIIIDNDTNKTYDIYLPYSAFSLNTAMMYKFSPDWELINAKPMVDHTEGIATSGELVGDSSISRYVVYLQGMSFDEDDNMYVSGYVSLELSGSFGGDLHQYPIHLYWDSTHYATIQDVSSSDNMPFILKYNTDGNILWCNQIYTTGSYNPNTQNLVGADWKGSCFKDNHLYITGWGVVKGGNAMLAFDNQGHFLQPFTNNNSTTGFFVRYNATTGQYENYGIIPAENVKLGQFPAIIENRIFAYSTKRAIHQWRIDGTYLNEININSVINCSLSKTSLTVDGDGHLLLGMTTSSSGSFGNGVSFGSPSGISSAVFALYNNPEFATPYVGISEYEDKLSHLKIGPNPTNNLLHIESDNSTIDVIILMNINGKTLMQKSVGNGSVLLDVSPLPAGIYLLKTVCKDHVSIEKIIKTND